MYQSLNAQVSERKNDAALRYPSCEADSIVREWFAVYTYPQHEKTCARQLADRGVEAFLPIHTQERVWKNRQRVRMQLPLFPSYLFVHVGNRERSRVLSVPGVLRVLGNARGPQPIPKATIELLRSDLFKDKLVPQPELTMGQRVRIRNGAMQGVEGVLVRQKNSLWFVLSIELINQRAMVQIRSQDVEPVPE